MNEIEKEKTRENKTDRKRKRIKRGHEIRKERRQNTKKKRKKQRKYGVGKGRLEK
jgi:hypothetical protein